MKDPYVYEGTSILVNLANIRDEQKLNEYEATMTRLALADMLSKPFEIKGAEDIFEIHKAIFGDVYSWAGEARTINIYKQEPILNGLSVNYCDHGEIKTELSKISVYLNAIDWVSLSKKEMIHETAKTISRIWKVHAFREGNTRTTATFLFFFLKQIGLKLSSSFIGEHAKYFRNALAMNSIDEYSEPEHLENILLDSISIKVADGDNKKYQTIRGYEVEKYQYQPHMMVKPK